MTINMLFFTIIIKNKSISPEEADHQEQIKQRYEQNSDRMLQVNNWM